MTDLLSIKPCGISSFNNLEYAYLITRVQKYADLAGAKALGISNSFLVEMKKHVNKISEISYSSQSSDQTALLNELDEKRDELLVYFLSQIRTSCKSPIANQSTAANSLYLLTKLYIGSQNLPNNQKSQQIINLQKDLAPAKVSEAVLALRLNVVIEKLLQINSEYDRTSVLRNEKNAQKNLGNCRDVRIILNKEYYYLVTMAGASALINPSPEATQFVKSMNILIKETKIAYNQRMAQYKSKTSDKIIPE